MSGTCPACLATAGAAARFCRSCGAALGLDSGLHPGSETDLGDAAPAGVTQAGATPVSVRRDAPTRWWLVAAALAIALVSGWAVIRPGGGPGDAAADGVAQADSDGSTPPDTGAGPEPTTDATVGAGSRGTAVTMRVVDEGEGPMLGRPVGWSLVLGDPYHAGSGLWWVDLDTGRRLRYPKVDGGPLLAVGDRLVMMEASPSSVGLSLRSISLADPTADPVPFQAPATLSMFSLVGASLTGPADGALWAYDEGSEPHWLMLSIETGGVIAEVPGGGGIVPGRGPELATSASWGLYRRIGDGHRLVAPGRPVAASGTDVLLETCSSPTDCRLAWVDEVTGEAVDRPTPPSDPVYWWQDLVPGSDRYLRGQALGDELYLFNPVVFDLVTGQMLDFEGVGQGVASSADGRFLLTSSNLFSRSPAGLVVYDAETGTPHPLGATGQITDTQAVFVPNG